MYAHWKGLGREMQTLVEQLTDQRLNELYRKLYSEGWAELRPQPLSTRNADQLVKNLIMRAIGDEQIIRAGREFDKMHRPGSGTRALSDAYGRYG